MIGANIFFCFRKPGYCTHTVNRMGTPSCLPSPVFRYYVPLKDSPQCPFIVVILYVYPSFAEWTER